MTTASGDETRKCPYGRIFQWRTEVQSDGIPSIWAHEVTTEYVAVDGDLADLARELQVIAEEATLSDGDMVTTPVVLWAEGWLITLAQLGIQPAVTTRTKQQ